MAVINRTLPFMQSPKFPEFSESKAVFMMGIDKSIEEAQNHDTVLRTSHEHTGDQVVWNMISS